MAMKKEAKPTIKEKGRKTPLILSPKKASTKYSPAPMKANDKKAAGFRGATTQYQINLKKKDAAAAKAKLKKELKPIKSESRSKAGSSLASKVAKRVAITAREARDVVTAAGTVAKGVKENKKFYTGGTVKNLKKQIVETGRAAVTGKRGTESDQIVSNKRVKGSSGQFTGQSRDKAKNKPGRSVTDATKFYKK